MMPYHSIAVLSAGNGGQALAADLALQGHAVSLYDLPQFAHTITTIRQRSNAIRLKNRLAGVATIELVTTDMQEALAGRSLIFFTAPSFAQKIFFPLMLPHLTDKQTVVLMPGNFGAIALKNMIHDAGKKCRVAETDNLPYACAIDADGVVDVRGIKSTVSLAACPAGQTSAVAVMLDHVFCSHSRCVQAHNVLETSMSSLNMVLHCGPMLANAARIEACERFQYYFEGVSKSVCNIVEACDNERLAVAKAYNLQLAPAKDVLKAQYDVAGETLYEVIQKNPAFAGNAPTMLRHRFLTEDTPSSLIPLLELGALAGLDTPVLRSLAILIGVLLGEKYTETGQTLCAMGLSQMSKQEIIEAVS